MAGTLTNRAKLRTPGLNHPRPSTGPTWNEALDANRAALDGVNAIGALCVTPADQSFDTFSGSLNVAVSAGRYRRADGTLGTYAGTASQAVSASTTSYLYLTDAGVLTVNTTGFPAGSPIVRLATVVTDATKVVSIADERIPFGSVTG